MEAGMAHDVSTPHRLTFATLLYRLKAYDRKRTTQTGHLLSKAVSQADLCGVANTTPGTTRRIAVHSIISNLAFIVMADYSFN